MGGCLAGCLAGWPAGRPAGRLAGWLGGWVCAYACNYAGGRACVPAACVPVGVFYGPEMGIFLWEMVRVHLAVVPVVSHICGFLLPFDGEVRACQT